MGRRFDTDPIKDAVGRSVRDAGQAVVAGIRRRGAKNSQNVERMRTTDRQQADRLQPQVVRNRERGKAAEAAVPGRQNDVRIDAPSGRARYRIPDRLDFESGVIGEIKDVSRQSLTSQLRDFIAFQQRNDMDLDLFVRPDTRISGPLQRLIDDPSNRINLHRIDFRNP